MVSKLFFHKKCKVFLDTNNKYAKEQTSILMIVLGMHNCHVTFYTFVFFYALHMLCCDFSNQLYFPCSAHSFIFNIRFSHTWACVYFNMFIFLHVDGMFVFFTSSHITHVIFPVRKHQPYFNTFYYQFMCK